MRFSGKAAFITGGASGIGARTARDFVREGASVVIFDTDKTRGKEVEKYISEEGGEILFAEGSVFNRSDVNKAVEAAFSMFGDIDFLVNSAGILRDSMLDKMSEEEWDDVIDVNLKGVFTVTQAIVKRWVDSARQNRKEEITQYPDKRIISMSSMAATGNVGQTNYAASKAGVIGMTLTWAKELVKYNIRAHAVMPSLIDTNIIEELLTKNDGKWKNYFKERIPFGIGKPKHVSDVILFLCSQESFFINGQIMQVNGGLVGEL